MLLLSAARAWTNSSAQQQQHSSPLESSRCYTMRPAMFILNSGLLYVIEYLRILYGLDHLKSTNLTWCWRGCTRLKYKIIHGLSEIVTELSVELNGLNIVGCHRERIPECTFYYNNNNNSLSRSSYYGWIIIFIGLKNHPQHRRPSQHKRDFLFF